MRKSRNDTYINGFFFADIGCEEMGYCFMISTVIYLLHNKEEKRSVYHAPS